MLTRSAIQVGPFAHGAHSWPFLAGGRRTLTLLVLLRALPGSRPPLAVLEYAAGPLHPCEARRESYDETTLVREVLLRAKPCSEGPPPREAINVRRKTLSCLPARRMKITSASLVGALSHPVVTVREGKELALVELGRRRKVRRKKGYQDFVTLKRIKKAISVLSLSLSFFLKQSRSQENTSNASFPLCQFHAHS